MLKWVRSWLAERQRFRPVDRLCKRISLGIATEEELRQGKCPMCGGPLEILFHPSGDSFHLFCPSIDMHFGRSRAVRSPPSWWSGHLADMWLD